MRRQIITQTGTGVSAPVPLDRLRNPFQVGFGVKLNGSATYTIQHTFDDVQEAGFDPNAAKWYDHPDVASLTADADGTYAFPVSAVRINQAAGAGSTTLTLLQAGHR